MIYLDHAASSYPKAPGVVDAVARFLETPTGSPGRSGYQSTVHAARTLFESRETVARLFGVKDSRRIIWTSGATESLNTALKGLVRPGDVVLLSRMQHNAVVRPLWRLVQSRKISIRLMSDPPVREEFDGVRLVVVCHGSNVSGEIAPIEQIVDFAHQEGALVVLDAAQTARVLPLNLRELGVDVMACSGHKGLLGPQGTGILYLREGVEPEPLKYGGTGSNSESEQQPENLPDRYESGTLNGPGIAGLGAAVAFLLQQGVENVQRHIERLGERFLSAIDGMPRIRLFRPHTVHRRLGTYALRLEGTDPASIAGTLDERYGIAVRAGLHCAPWAHRALGTFPHGTIRISFGHATTDREVDALITALRELSGE